MTDNHDASVMGLLFKLFQKTGSSTWHRRTVDWLLVYIMTEVAVTPHNIRQGRSAISLMSSYQSVVQALVSLKNRGDGTRLTVLSQKQKKYDPFKRTVTSQLTRDYLSLDDELSTVNVILRSKITGLESLRAAVVAAEEQSFRSHQKVDDTSQKPNNPTGESAIERLDWALANLHEAHQLGTRLLEETKGSIESVSIDDVRSVVKC